MIEWENGYGRKRYQPVRCDGAKLEYICAMFQCVVAWSIGEMGRNEPRVFRLRWVAVFRGRIGSWVYKRSNLRQIRPVC